MIDFDPKPQLVLASSSPRRRQLLQEAGYSFTVASPTIEEPDESFSHLTPVQQAESLAYFKARTIWDERPEGLVLGADTIVALGRTILGKPADEAEARRMLGMLSGSRHEVITGVALLGEDGARLIASEITRIVMRKMTPAEIDQYIATLEWQGKAGAYAIQETGDRFIEGIEGSFSNVVGLPMELLGRMLQEMLEHAEAHRVV